MLKKIIFSLLVPFLLFWITALVYAAGPNLVVNPSAEISNSDNSLPLDWQRDSWGSNNASFGYSNDGFEGSKSLSVNITNYQSGDAKWTFNHVAVTPNQTYTFSDYYKSTVASYLILQVKDTAGAISYHYLGYVAPSSTWNLTTKTFTASQNAETLTVFHLINSVGNLQIDSVSLVEGDSTSPTPTQTPSPTTFPTMSPTLTPTSSPTPTMTPTVVPTSTPTPTLSPSPTLTPTPTPTSQNMLFNSSLETVDQFGKPQSWNSNNWGSNTAIFTYLNSGYTGNRSVRTDVTSYQSGDAKWYPNHVSVVPGKTYQFTDYFMSNRNTGVVIEYKMTNNTNTYGWLGTAPTASSWTKFQNHFTVPENVTSLTVYHLISGVGFLVVDDYLLKEFTPQGFTRPIITLTFDDGYLSQYTNAAPRLANHNFSATFYLITGYLNTNNYMTRTQANNLKNAGHQLAAHTINHPNLTTITPTELTNQLVRPKTDINNWFGVDTMDFCSPFGAYNTDTINAIRNYYSSHRTTDSGLNYKNEFDIYKIKVRNIKVTTTISEVRAWIDEAKANNAWLVIVYHQVDNSGNEYSTTPTNFNAQLTEIKNSNTTVKTLNAALAEISPQLN